MHRVNASQAVQDRTAGWLSSGSVAVDNDVAFVTHEIRFQLDASFLERWLER